jgi:heat-inducible transcriptional repressor
VAATGLNARSRKILFAVVTEYIGTGKPVGSRTLSRKYGLDLSPATIRNVLADLEEGGMVHQPHTSAGRVPTDRALRLFIEALTEFHAIPHATKLDLRKRLDVIFTEDGLSRDDAMRQAGRILSDIAGAAAVIAPTPVTARKLQQLRFIPITDGRLLAVLVFSDGVVENRYVDSSIAGDDLIRVQNLLADVVEGRTLGDVRALLASRLDDERVAVDEIRKNAFELARDAVSDVARSADDLVIEGRAVLIDLPEYTDIERLKRLVRVLEDREHLIDLLDRTMKAGAVTVYLGQEAGELGEAQLSLVVAPFGDDSKGGGLGVLGPTRMDYARMLPLVETAAAAMTAALKKSK